MLILNLFFQDLLKSRKDEDTQIERNLLRRLFPELSEQTEAEATKILQQLRCSNTSQSSKQNQTEADDNLIKIEKLKTQLNNYESILLETEKMLQNLETHIKTEEKKWREELLLKDFEINNLKDQLNNSNLRNGQSLHSNQKAKNHNTSNGLTENDNTSTD